MPLLLPCFALLLSLVQTGRYRSRRFPIAPCRNGGWFLTDDYDSDRHYPVPYHHHDSKHPKGFSGAAAWWQSNQPLQVLRASAVRRFHEEVFGPA
jgi:hypothetical protein